METNSQIAYEMGWKSFMDGKRWNENPFTKDEFDFYDSWCEGFKSAMNNSHKTNGMMIFDDYVEYF